MPDEPYDPYQTDPYGVAPRASVPGASDPGQAYDPYQQAQGMYQQPQGQGEGGGGDFGPPQPGVQPPHVMHIYDGAQHRAFLHPATVGGMPLRPSEVELAQLHQQIGSAQLSPADQRVLSQYENGESAVGEQINNGTLTPQEGQQLMEQIGQAAGPLRVRASQLPILMQRLQYISMQHQMAQQTALEQQNADFRASTAQQRMSTLTNPLTGEVIHMFEQRPGHHVPIEWPSQGGQRGQQQLLDAHRRIVEHHTDRVMADLAAGERPDAAGQTHLPEWFTTNNGPEGPRNPDRTREQRIREEINRRVRQAHEMHGTHPPNEQPSTYSGRTAGSATPPPEQQAFEELMRRLMAAPPPSTGPAPTPPPPQFQPTPRSRTVGFEWPWETRARIRADQERRARELAAGTSR